jgi:hypothetical protein
MLNIKNLFITTGISVLFGVYTIYNIIDALRLLNNGRIKQTTNLQHLVNETNSKYIHLQTKHNDLLKNYHELFIKYENITKEIHQLNIKINELEENHFTDIDIYNDNPSLSNNITSSNSNSITCDELCNLNTKIPRVHLETMNAIFDEDFEESLYLDYESSELNCDSNTNTELSSLCNSEKSSIKSRSRSTSVTDINWGAIAKKLFFG